MTQKDDKLEGELNYFEITSACVFPHDLVVKRKSGKDHDGKHASVANVTATL